MQAKLALAKELAVRRMAEILTQALWTKVDWRHEDATDRDFLLNKEEYIWTGEKYQNSNRRFPNFNFSIFDTEEYLFLVTHPLALTGVYASGPLTDSMPDPREAFAEELKDLDEESKETTPSPSSDSEDPKMLGPAELRAVCEPECPVQRRACLQHALLGKFAYYRTVGQTKCRQWSQVVLGQQPVTASASSEESENLAHQRSWGCSKLVDS